MANYLNRSFYWVMNNLDIACGLPVELELPARDNNLILQFDRANADEIALIRQHIYGAFPTGTPAFPRLPPYEYDQIYEDTGEPVVVGAERSGVAQLSKLREEENLRYFVLAYPAGGTYPLLTDIVLACNILVTPLILGFHYTAHRDGSVSYAGNIQENAYYDAISNERSTPHN